MIPLQLVEQLNERLHLVFLCQYSVDFISVTNIQIVLFDFFLFNFKKLYKKRPDRCFLEIPIIFAPFSNNNIVKANCL